MRVGVEVGVLSGVRGGGSWGVGRGEAKDEMGEKRRQQQEVGWESDSAKATCFACYLTISLP